MEYRNEKSSFLLTPCGIYPVRASATCSKHAPPRAAFLQNVSKEIKRGYPAERIFLARDEPRMQAGRDASGVLIALVIRESV